MQGSGVPARGSKTALTSQTAWGKEGCLLAWQTMGGGQDETPILPSLLCPSLWRDTGFSHQFGIWGKVGVKTQSNRASPELSMLCSLAQAAPEGSSSAWPLKKVNISFSKTRPYSPPLPYAWPSCSRKSPLPCMRMLFTYRNEGRVWCCLQGSCVFPALCPTCHRACCNPAGSQTWHPEDTRDISRKRSELGQLPTFFLCYKSPLPLNLQQQGAGKKHIVPT